MAQPLNAGVSYDRRPPIGGCWGANTRVSNAPESCRSLAHHPPVTPTRMEFPLACCRRRMAIPRHDAREASGGTRALPIHRRSCGAHRPPPTLGYSAQWTCGGIVGSLVASEALALSAVAP